MNKFGQSFGTLLFHCSTLSRTQFIITINNMGATGKCRNEEKIRVLFSVIAPISPPFTIYLHNFTF